ncbi:hypothetical protein CMV_003044 [Castanea mollissima]|uniref:Uncharacterized protein n=1 Tax=Castanea mollissima TaxID=60419 RepID=A0A8J4RSS3_9ROSI|nr:hypothetical protein CMV_003044 [Castanea mollissima]
MCEQAGKRWNMTFPAELSQVTTIKSSFWDVRHIRLRKNQTLSVPKLKLLPHLLQQSPLQEAEISTNKGVVPH